MQVHIACVLSILIIDSPSVDFIITVILYTVRNKNNYLFKLDFINIKNN